MMAVEFNLPRDHYPLRMAAFRRSDGERVWETRLAEPGPLHVPPLALEHGQVDMLLAFGNGTRTWSGPGPWPDWP